MTESFGKQFKEYRERRGITKRQVEKVGGVDHANTFRVEEQGKPVTLATAFAMTVGAGMDDDTARRFLDLALRDRIADDVRRHAILTALREGETMLRHIVRRFAALNAPWGREEATVDVLKAWLITVAERDEYVAERDWVARHLYKSVTLDLETGEITVRQLVRGASNPNGSAGEG